ncbi:RING-H2 finger protein [Arachis hypogaea]|nr:RING-H2 finger protein [Arachis hypogaea]
MKLPPLVTYESQDMQKSCSDCAICMESFQDGQSCQVFPECKHMFHSDCMDRWLQKKSTCPICRSCILLD